MGSKKLIYCCILGILLGFLAPFVLKTDGYISLMIGMAGGLGIGYLLDIRDSKKSEQPDRKSLGEKADKANRLMERARRGVENEYLRMDYGDDEESEAEDPDPLADISDPDAEAAEQAEKLSKAEELLRSAREKMK